MKPKTEEFLYSVSWGLYVLGKPTWRSMTESYEAWAYREGLQRQLEKLRRKKLIEVEEQHGGSATRSRLIRLTQAGHVHVLGGRDPETRWNREWDGRWRVVMFDVPLSQGVLRDKLRRHLSSRSFGCLQQSVWVTPDPLDEQKKILEGTEANSAALFTLEARPATGETDEEIVLRAWDFAEINRRYSKLLEILNQRPEQKLQSENAAVKFRKWAAQERGAWRDAIAKDPLLPASLVPPGYLGRKAWQARRNALKAAHEQIAGFELGLSK